MQHPNIPIQRPIAVSLGIHILIFGTALAFAQYGGALLGGDHTVLTVSLVGPGAGKGAAPARTAGGGMAAGSLRDDAGRSMAVPAPQSVSEGTVGTQMRNGGASDATADEGPAGGPEGDLNGNAGGSFSSERWSRVFAALERAKTYPRFARERGIEGIVLMRFKVAPSGDIEKVDIVKSSGSDILDQASVRTVYRAAPMPYVSGWIEVPMSYELK